MQSDIGSVCRTNLEFMKWADEIMLAALLKVPTDRASADTGSSFKSMLDTLNHVYLAELVWFKRIQGETQTARRTGESGRCNCACPGVDGPSQELA